MADISYLNFVTFRGRGNLFIFGSAMLLLQNQAWREMFNASRDADLLKITVQQAIRAAVSFRALGVEGDRRQRPGSGSTSVDLYPR